MKPQKAHAGVAMAFCIAAMSCTPTARTEDRNRDLLLKANDEILTKGNLQYADEAFAADYASPGYDLKGPALINSFVNQLKQGFPDLKITVDQIVAEGNMVSWRRTHTGTHTGDFMGYKATGKVITWTEFNLTQFAEDGKILQEWGAGDLETALQRANGIEGTYEFLPPLKGQASMRNGRFNFVFGSADGKQPLKGQAGTYVVKDDIVTNTYTYSTDPKEVGQSFSWKVKSWSGDTATYTIMNDKGEPLREGRSLRINY